MNHSFIYIARIMDANWESSVKRAADELKAFPVQIHERNSVYRTKDDGRVVLCRACSRSRTGIGYIGYHSGSCEQCGKTLTL